MSEIALLTEYGGFVWHGCHVTCRTCSAVRNPPCFNPLRDEVLRGAVAIKALFQSDRLAPINVRARAVSSALYARRGRFPRFPAFDNTWFAQRFCRAASRLEPPKAS